MSPDFPLALRKHEKWIFFHPATVYIHRSTTVGYTVHGLNLGWCFRSILLSSSQFHALCPLEDISMSVICFHVLLHTTQCMEKRAPLELKHVSRMCVRVRACRGHCMYADLLGWWNLLQIYSLSWLYLRIYYYVYFLQLHSNGAVIYASISINRDDRWTLSKYCCCCCQMRVSLSAAIVRTASCSLTV